MFKSRILSFFLFLCVFGMVDAASNTPTALRRDRDFEALQEFVNSKRTIPFNEKASRLKIFGSIRTNYIYRSERDNGEKVRGRGRRRQHNDLDAEFNLKIKYKCEDSWASVRLQQYNAMGVDNLFNRTCATDSDGLFGSGQCNQICLREAFIGYRLFKDCDDYLDFEIGRRRLYNLYDSRIQFNERYDGYVLNYHKKVPISSEWYVKGGPFIIDYRTEHYGWVAETGIFDLYETKLDLKYSFISWLSDHNNRCGNPSLASQFENHQWTVAYNINPKAFWGNRGKLYGAYLVNMAANTLIPPGAAEARGKANRGWYVGFIAGDTDMKDAGDWAVDINYQYVQAQAVPESDARGIKRGNARGGSLLRDGGGQTNYKGWHIEALYALSSCISFDVVFQISKEIDKQVGGHHTYRKFEFDTIFAF